MKKILKYQMTDMVKSLFIYYLIIIIIFGVSGFAASLHSDNIANMSDPNFSTAIFAFGVGIAIYKEHWLMAAQNGISRKAFFKSCITFSFIFSLINVVFSGIFLYISELILENIPNFSIFKITELMYSSFFTDATVLTTFGINILFAFFLIIASYIIGLLIAAIYCRIPKKVKTIFVIALPICIFVGIPGLSMLFPDVASKVFDFFITIMGLTSGKENPLLACLTMAIIYISGSGCSYILLRKTEV